MKTRTIIFTAIILLGIIVASCTEHTCPAYSKTNVETTESAG